MNISNMQRKGKMQIRFFATGFVLSLLVTILVFLLFLSFAPGDDPQSNQDQDIGHQRLPVIPAEDNTSDWRTYRNREAGVTFQAPHTMEVKTDYSILDNGSVLVRIKLTEQKGKAASFAIVRYPVVASHGDVRTAVRDMFEDNTGLLKFGACPFKTSMPCAVITDDADWLRQTGRPIYIQFFMKGGQNLYGIALSQATFDITSGIGPQIIGTIRPETE
jgi:hypothetical protein